MESSYKNRKVEGRWASLTLIVHLLGTILLLLFTRSYDELRFDASGLIYPFCWVILGLTIWGFWSWYLVTGSLFDPYVIFLSAAVMFNGGHALLETLHLNEYGILDNQFDQVTIALTLMYVAAGLSTFHLGAIAAAWMESRKQTGNLLEQKSHDFGNVAVCRLIGWGLLIISLGPVFIQARQSISVVQRGGYASLYLQNVDVGVNAIPIILGSFIVPAVILLLISASGSRTTIAISVIVMLLYSAIQFFLGYRAAAAWPLAAYAWAFHRSVRRIPGWFILTSGCLLLFVVFPVVRETRVNYGGQRYDVATIISSWKGLENPVVTSVSELGGSMRTIAYTLQLVPTYRPYERGASYGYAILTVVPNIGTELHTSRARGTPTEWLVRTVAPRSAEQGGGFGYSFIAEAYLNFGWTGGVTALAGIGYLFGRIFVPSISTKSRLTIFLASCFLAFLTNYARGDASSIVRPFFWYTIGPILLITLLSQFQQTTYISASSHRPRVTRNL